MNWLDSEELRFVQTVTDNKQEKCKTSSGPFKVLSDKSQISAQDNIVPSTLQASKGRKGMY